jgi:cation transporter-like permease
VQTPGGPASLRTAQPHSALCSALGSAVHVGAESVQMNEEFAVKAETGRVAAPGSHVIYRYIVIIVTVDWR